MKKMFAMCAVLAAILSTKAWAEPAAPAESYDVVVIGAGGGGLAAAATLSLHGMKVLVIEQHDKVGGYMTRFERDDYKFEVSLHAMDGLNSGGMTRRTFQAVGILDRVKPVKLDPMYRAIYPDFTMDIPAEVKAYCQLLKTTFPAEAEGIDGLFETMGKINQSMLSLIELADGGSLLKILARPWRFWPVVKYWNKTLAQLVGDYVHDPRLVAVFTELAGFAGGEPAEVSAIFFAMMWNSYHFGGYYYFEGGSQSVSDAMAEVIKENHGQILLSTLATKIVMENGRAAAVQTSDGALYKCRWVVSNANAPATFFKLVGREHLPPDYVKQLESMKIGLSAYVVYLGVDHDYCDKFPHGVHELMISEIYDQHQNFEWYRQGVPEKISFAVANYSTVDPTAAPPGKNVICLTTIMPYDYKGDWYESESYEKYKALKEEVAQVLIRRAEKFLPELSRHIEVMEVGSPRTMEHYTLNPHGTIFGWDNIPSQSMMKRLPQKTPIPNLFLAGAWTFPGGGQSAVMASGVSAARLILQQEKKR